MPVAQVHRSEIAVCGGDVSLPRSNHEGSRRTKRRGSPGTSRTKSCAESQARPQLFSSLATPSCVKTTEDSVQDFSSKVSHLWYSSLRLQQRVIALKTVPGGENKILFSCSPE